jgi:hypothetical protein
MIESEKIIELCAEAAKKMQKSTVFRSLGYDKKFNLDKYVESLPEFNEIYQDTIKQHYKVKVHAELDCFPYEILRSKAPNQSQEEWDYQCGLYESYTNSTWNSAKSRTKLVGNPQNYEIKGWDSEQRKYFYEDYPTYHSLLAFFFDIVRDIKIDYPNQAIVIMPKEIPGEYEDDDEGNKIFVADQSVMIEPVVSIIEEEYIVKYKEGRYILFIVDDEIGKLRFKFIDDESIYEINQTGNDSFELIKQYSHNWGYCPAKKLGGKPILVDGEILYHSVFVDAIPDLNDVIRLNSNLAMSTYSMLFPVRIAVVDKCMYRNESGGSCQDGRIWCPDPNGGGTYGTCPGCNGTGRTNHHSPTGVYEVMASNQIGGVQSVLPMTPPVQFAAPDTAIYDKVEQTIQLKKESAFSFLFKRENMVGKSATEAENEKESLHGFLIDFASQLFDLIEFSISAIGFMRYGDAFVMPSVSKPTSFTFITNDEITSEIAESVKNKMPIPYTSRLIESATATRFNSDKAAEQFIMTALKLDALAFLDDLTIRANLNTTITPIEAIIHQRIDYFIRKAEIEYPDFYELDDNRQEEIITGYAQEVLNLLTPTVSNPAAAVLTGSL